MSIQIVSKFRSKVQMLSCGIAVGTILDTSYRRGQSVFEVITWEEWERHTGQIYIEKEQKVPLKRLCKNTHYVYGTLDEIGEGKFHQIVN